jgi:hypothetical protein
MNPATNLDQFLDQQNFHDPDVRTQVKAQIMAYALEAAVAKLNKAGLLSEAEQQELQAMFASGNLADLRFEHIFNTPERQTVLAQSFVEAMDIVAAAK